MDCSALDGADELSQSEAKRVVSCNACAPAVQGLASLRIRKLFR